MPLPAGATAFASYLVAFVIFVNITRVGSLFGFLEAMELPLLLTALAVIVMLAQAARWHANDLTSHWIPKLLIVVLIFAILSIPTALHKGASFNALTRGFSQSLLGFMLAFGVARTHAGRRLLARTIAVSGTVTGALALIWNRKDNTGRLGGAATYDANDLALILSITLPLLIWWFFDNRSKIRWLAILALPMLFSIMLRTSSRGGFLGMVAILAGLLFIGTTGRVREVRRIAITGIVLAALGALALPATYKERMSSMGEEVDNTSPSARINVWKRGIGYTFDNPIFGVGIGNFGRAEGILSDYSQSKGGRGVKWSTAHSSYIQTFAELGIIGGLAFSIAVIGGTLALLWWRPPGWLVDPAQRMLTPMVGLSLGAFAVSGAFLSFAYASPPYYLLGFATALLLPGTLHGNRSAMPGGMSSTTQSPLRRRPVQSQFSRYPAPPPPRMRH